MDVVLVEELAELVLHEQEVLGAGAHDGVDLMTGLDQVLGDREGNCQTDAAANDGTGALSHLGGNAQRAHDVAQRLAGLVGGKHFGGLADHHEDELDPALVTVPAG